MGIFVVSTISQKAFKNYVLIVTKRVVQHNSAIVCQKHGVQEDKKCFEKESKDHRIYPLPSLVDSVHQFLFN